MSTVHDKTDGGVEIECPTCGTLCTAGDEYVPIEDNECRVHGFAEHGKEAEELRAGVESIIEEFDGVDFATVETVCGVLRALLERVDARDSIAYLERRDARKAKTKRTSKKRRVA